MLTRPTYIFFIFFKYILFSRCGPLNIFLRTQIVEIRIFVHPFNEQQHYGSWHLVLIIDINILNRLMTKINLITHLKFHIGSYLV